MPVRRASNGSGQRSRRRTEVVVSIDRAELLELIDQGAQVVDVLPDAEYTAQHIPGAINLPLRRLDMGSTAVLRRDKPVVVH